jgi:NitT/TauT family transport system permease protein
MKAAAIRYSPLLLIAFVWQMISVLHLVSNSVLPSLTEVGRAWVELAREKDFWINGEASLYRGAAGLALAIGIGGALGILMAWSRLLQRLVNPIVEIFYPLPKSALIPVTALWLGFGDSSKILLIFLGCMLPVTLGAYNGARGAERTLKWSALSLGAGQWRMLWDVIVPSALPEMLNGIRTALATSFVLLVSSEMIAARRGFGYLIGFLGDGGAYPEMFAVVFTVAFLGFAADRLYQFTVDRTMQWR